MEVHREDIECGSVHVDGMQILFGLDDLHWIWKTRKDAAWESWVLEGHTHVLNCVSAIVEETQLVSGFFGETLQMRQVKDGIRKSTVT